MSYIYSAEIIAVIVASDTFNKPRTRVNSTSSMKTKKTQPSIQTSRYVT